MQNLPNEANFKILVQEKAEGLKLVNAFKKRNRVLEKTTQKKFYFKVV